MQIGCLFDSTRNYLFSCVIQKALIANKTLSMSWGEKCGSPTGNINIPQID